MTFMTVPVRDLLHSVGAPGCAYTIKGKFGLLNLRR